MKPLFPLNKTVLNFQGRTRLSLCQPWLKSQPGGRSKTSFLAFAKANLFFFSPAVAVKWTKEVSSHQPYERKEPVPFVKPQYFCVHLQMWTAEVAAAPAEPTKVVYSRWLFPAAIQFRCCVFFFSYLRLILSVFYRKHNSFNFCFLIICIPIHCSLENGACN